MSERGFLVECQHCHHLAEVASERFYGISGPLRCFGCCCPITRVKVQSCRVWAAQQVERKRQMQKTGALHSRKQSQRHSDEEIDWNGLIGELATCVLLCPGRLRDWQTATESGGGNRGRDLLGAWVGLPKTIEVKSTEYHDCHLIVRPPSGYEPRMKREYIDDCYYVLVTPEQEYQVIRGWTDQVGFLSDYEENPRRRSDDGCDYWGVHHSRLKPLDDMPFFGGACVVTTGPQAASKLDLWWGHSLEHGWIVLNWADRRNRPGRSPRFLHMLRCRDDAEIAVPFGSWSPPEFTDADQRIAKEPDPNKRGRLQAEWETQIWRFETRPDQPLHLTAT